MRGGGGQLLFVTSHGQIFPVFWGGRGVKWIKSGNELVYGKKNGVNRASKRVNCR